MIVYLIAALLLFWRYGTQRRKAEAEMQPKLLLAGGLFFFIAALLSLTEFLLKTKHPVLDLIMIISGAGLIGLIAAEERKKAKAGGGLGFDREADRIRNEIIRHTERSVHYHHEKTNEFPDSSGPDQKPEPKDPPGGDRNDKI